MPPNSSSICAFCRHAATLPKRPGRVQRNISLRLQGYKQRDDLPVVPSALLRSLGNQLQPISPRVLLRNALVEKSGSKPDYRRKERERDELAQNALKQAILEKKLCLTVRDNTEAMGDHPELEGKEVGRLAIRIALQHQLAACEKVTDLVRIIGGAFDDVIAKPEFLESFDAVVTAFERVYKCLMKATRTDKYQGISRVLHALSTILYRLRALDTPVDPKIEKKYMEFAADFAARNGQPRALWTYLSGFRRRGMAVDAELFRRMCDGISGWVKETEGEEYAGALNDARRILFEQTQGEMVQVLLGRDGMGDAESCHLAVWHERSNLDSCASWISLLSIFKQQEELWKEWELWRFSPLREKLGVESAARAHDVQFVHAMTPLSTKRAWDMLHQSKLHLTDLPVDLRLDLVMCPPPGTAWTPEMEQASLEMLERELGKVEAAFGVEWQAGGNGEGTHLKLDDPFWSMEEDLIEEKDLA